jgi:DNA-binding XRE family transcriptional regulator
MQKYMLKYNHTNKNERGETMTLGERMLQYRAKHHISQGELAHLLDTNLMAIYRCEKGCFKMHKANEARLQNKMNWLEKEEVVKNV